MLTPILSRTLASRTRPAPAHRLPIAAGLFGESLEGHAIVTRSDNRQDG